VISPFLYRASIFRTTFKFFLSEKSNTPDATVPSDPWLQIATPAATPDVWVEPYAPAPYKDVKFPRARIRLVQPRTGDVYRLPNVSNPPY
jgi:hypothetical protein